MLRFFGDGIVARDELPTSTTLHPDMLQFKGGETKPGQISTRAVHKCLGVCPVAESREPVEALAGLSAKLNPGTQRSWRSHCFAVSESNTVRKAMPAGSPQSQAAQMMDVRSCRHTAPNLYVTCILPQMQRAVAGATHVTVQTSSGRSRCGRWHWRYLSGQRHPPFSRGGFSAILTSDGSKARKRAGFHRASMRAERRDEKTRRFRFRVVAPRTGRTH